MKKLLILLFVVVLQASASASIDCYSSFMDAYEAYDSKSFVLHDDKLEADFDLDSKKYAKEAVSQILRPVAECADVASALVEEERSSAKSLEAKVSCKELIPGKWYSKACYVELEMGYFFMSQDMLGNVNLIFNRWD